MLPREIYEHVDDNWGDPGVEGAEYVYNLFIQELEQLRAEVQHIRNAYDRDAELFFRPPKT